MDPNGRRRKRGRPVHGWLVLDKAHGLGSTKAVGRARWLLEARKAGHAGTLDPLATGVLPIAFGEATKTVPWMVDAAKAYQFTVAWGAETATGDLEGEIVETSGHRPTEAAVLAALSAFTGDIEQVPPRYSAIKIGGKRAYDLARAGEDVEVPSRTVRVDDLRLVRFDGDSATLEVDCGKGTYVRSLARDLARAVGTVGHVTHLRRTRVGPFTLDAATTLDAVEAMDYVSRVEALLPLRCALDDIPVLAVGAKGASDLKQGRRIPLPSPHSGTVLAMSEGVEVAICEACDGELVPKRVFNL